jgi:XTP/dITP diphosphohydrolase
LPALADDAGLCVDAFGGLPGVDTAYYATQFGYAKSDDNNVRALLEQMRDLDNRRAAMVSTLVAVRSAARPRALDGRGPGGGPDCTRRLGSNGFGFDPVMFIPEFGKPLPSCRSRSKTPTATAAAAARAMVALMRDNWLP